MKLNDKEELICIKSILKYTKGYRYKFRFDPPDAIYIYYPLDYVRTYFGDKVGNKFLTIPNSNIGYWGVYCYSDYFITLQEYRKLKLLKIQNEV